MLRSVTSMALRASPLARLSNLGAIRCLSSSAINSGTVKWFDVKKGFGFISPEDGSADVFVHQSAIHADGFRSLADGEAVEYSTFQDQNGKIKAENVTGPMGAYVQGAAPRRSNDYGGGSYGGRGGGFGGGRGGGASY